MIALLSEQADVSLIPKKLNATVVAIVSIVAVTKKHTSSDDQVDHLNENLSPWTLAEPASARELVLRSGCVRVMPLKVP